MDSEKIQRNKRHFENMRIEREKQAKKKKQYLMTVLLAFLFVIGIVGYKVQLFSMTDYKTALEKGMIPRIKTLLFFKRVSSENLSYGLAEAIKQDNLELAKLLVENGANVNFEPKKGASLLSLAVILKSNKVGNYLIEKGANTSIKAEADGVSFSLLDIAISTGNFEMVKALVNETKINKINDAGLSPLYVAVSVEKPSLDIIKYLVEKGANINLGDKTGMPAIVLAVLRDNLDIIKILAESGQNIKKNYSGGVTLFDFAVSDKVKNYLESLGVRKSIYNE